MKFLTTRNRNIRHTDTRQRAKIERFISKFVKFYLPKLTLIIVLTAALYFGNKYIKESDNIKIKNINIVGVSKYVNSKDFANVTHNLLIGRNIFSINLNVVENSLLDSFQGARKISVIKKLPNTIEISVVERFPVAVVNTQTNEKYLLDEEGYVLGFVGESYYDLPVVSYAGNLLVGTFLDKKLVPITLEILRSAKKEDLELSSVSFAGRYSSFFVKGGTQVLISNEKSIETSLKVVAKMLKVSENPDFTTSVVSNPSKILSKIDLRYDKVIVSY